MARSRNITEHRGAEQHLARPTNRWTNCARCFTISSPRPKSPCSISTTTKHSPRLAAKMAPEKVIDYSLTNPRRAPFCDQPNGRGRTVFAFDVKEGDTTATVHLRVPGAHNGSHMRWLHSGAAIAVGASSASRRQRLERFGNSPAARGRREGQRHHRDRRLAHKPRQDRRDPCDAARLSGTSADDVSAARLRTAALDEGCFHRLLRHDMRGGDILVMPEPVYFGGTTSRNGRAADIVEGVRSRMPRRPMRSQERAACGDKLIDLGAAGRSHRDHGCARRHALDICGRIAATPRSDALPPQTVARCRSRTAGAICGRSA